MSADGFRVGDFIVEPGRNTVITPGSEEIRLEPKVMAVLCVLAERAGEVVSRRALIDKVWQVDYGADEGPTRAISKLRKIFEGNGGPRAIETVPKRGYRLAAPVSPPEPEPETAGLPHDEGSPGGEAHDESEGEGGLAGRPSGFRHAGIPVLALAALSVLGIFILSFRHPVIPEATGFQPDRVAMGTLQVVDEDRDNPKLAAFADSLSANISSILSENGVETVARSAHTEESGAEFSLRGAVERHDNRYRAVLRLDHDVFGAALWSFRFEREASEAAALSDQAAMHTAHVLRCAFGFRRSEPDMAHRVFAAYLRFCNATIDWNAWKNLAAYSEQVLKAAPDSTQAKALHALVLATRRVRWWVGTAEKREKEVRKAEARRLARQVLLVDPENSIARSVMALTLPIAGNWAEVEAGLRPVAAHVADSANTGWPETTAKLALGKILQQVGRPEEAIFLIRRAVAADPLNIRAHIELALANAASGWSDRAIAELEKAKRINPRWGEVPFRRFQIEFFYRTLADAEAQLKGPDTAFSRNLPAAQHYLCAETIIRVRKSDRPDMASVDAACTGNNDWRARIYACLGDLDRTHAAVSKFPLWEEEWAIWLFFPCLREFRRDPRFWTIAAEFGLVDYWLETGKWPDFCREKDLPFDCRKRALGVKLADTQAH